MMPGFLGSWEEFGRKYRLPVESNREPEAARRLAKIVRPYMLRRTKEAVASELPPKTEVLEWVELAGAQRDLYESLRLAMSKRVRDEISRKGLAKSQIIVLDALLKLRQACCDPRLVKTATAKHVKTSAKLDRLMDLIDELRSEDRKALIFSQFTTMLALISERLNERGYQYVTITGDTEDRETPVKEFQHGDVPLFLISLKAGGTGLNLTAAETVIHYDPWWNPAVERQATDRAHRIGQTKPVFVHKLIASNTVEERILEMQARKSDLATALLEGSENTSFSLTQEDIQWIFE
jgi:SNF2 family DNA or RNA helicase